MSWQYSDAPSHIGPETGSNLLSGSGPWTGVDLDPGAVYVLSVEVNAPGETTVGWGVTAVDETGGEFLLSDPALTETVPGGQWVTVTRDLPAPGFPTTAAVTLAIPDGTQVRNPSMGARTGRTIVTIPGDVLAENIMASGGIVAGDPEGARVELADEGLVSYDSTGAETARIAGEGGEFVGGSFRTSDALPGQVQLSDDAYITHLDGGGAWPGIRVTPIDTTNMEYPAGIGPSEHGLTIYSGREVGGGSSFVQSNPTESLMRVYRAGGGMGGLMQVSPEDARMRVYRADGGTGSVMQASLEYSQMRTFSGNGSESGHIWTEPSRARMGFVDSNNEYVSRIHSDANEAHLYTNAGGGYRYLSIDANGVWVKEDGWDDIDLTAAYRSQWTNLDYRSGFEWPHGAPLGYNKIGKRIFMRGRIAKTDGTDFPSGGFQTIITMSEGWRPEFTTGILTPAQGTSVARVEISAASGEITVTPQSATSWVSLDGLFYDLP